METLIEPSRKLQTLTTMNRSISCLDGHQTYEAENFLSLWNVLVIRTWTCEFRSPIFFIKPFFIIINIIDSHEREGLKFYSRFCNIIIGNRLWCTKIVEQREREIIFNISDTINVYRVLINEQAQQIY